MANTVSLAGALSVACATAVARCASNWQSLGSVFAFLQMPACQLTLQAGVPTLLHTYFIKHTHTDTDEFTCIYCSCVYLQGKAKKCRYISATAFNYTPLTVLIAFSVVFGVDGQVASPCCNCTGDFAFCILLLLRFLPLPQLVLAVSPCSFFRTLFCFRFRIFSLCRFCSIF